MRGYSLAATKAAETLNRDSTISPLGAWQRAVEEVLSHSRCQQVKGCPKGTFLGLCEDGYIKGVAPGSYTSSELNKRYAVEAAKRILKDSNLRDDVQLLWRMVTSNSGKAHNSQMNVVVGLSIGGFLQEPREITAA
jgi:hypothetical protein